jgi:hypothetical protein
VSTTGPPGPPTGPGQGPVRPFQPVRAAAVVIGALAVGVAVLARMGGGHSLASTVPSTTSQNGTTTTTSAPVSPTSSTTVPAATTTSTIAPSKVTVLVLNGGSTYHAALFFQTRLQGYGYDTLSPADATAETYKTTEIFHIETAARPNALEIAQLLGAPATSVATPNDTDEGAIPTGDRTAADVIVVVGADISKQVPANYNGSTTTTAAAATTTAPAETTTAA